MDRAMSLAEPGRARLGWPEGGGWKERRVFSPEAAVVLCQAGSVVSDVVPRFSAQVVEQQHRLVCFCANSSSTPRPDHCLFSLCVHILRHSYSTSDLSAFLSPLHCTIPRIKVRLAFCWVNNYETHSFVQGRADELSGINCYVTMEIEHLLCCHISSRFQRIQCVVVQRPSLKRGKGKSQ